MLNDGLACNFIMTGIDEAERQFIAKENALEVWTALKKRHGGAGPVQQVHLLKDALTTKFSTSTPDEIFDKVDQAFNIGTVTADLLKSIAVIAALSSPEVMITNKDGHVFHVEGKESFLATYLNTHTGDTTSKQEFASLATSDTPSINDLEAEERLKYDLFIAMDGDLGTDINQTDYTTESAFIGTTPY
ncbi:hypothetical protein C0991_006992 [Blastosporella zonata]|nr:hypothetical protein C0991_006992 [Blastosporella zonata]